MADKKDDTKIGGVKSTKVTTGVESTEAVGTVGGVKATSSIGGVGRAGSIGKQRGTRTMSFEEREQLFKMINEEAEKMFKSSGMSKDKQQMVAEAVKIAVDSGLLEEEQDDKK